jgi:hydroxyacylglutathione hydrolase
MIVEQIWTGNAYRNFNYLIACGETGEAMAIDPLDHQKCLTRAKELGWEITQVLNTHEHPDHTGVRVCWRMRTRGTQSLA